MRSYVYVNEDHTERWSTFEEYLPEISMFYLAATDADIPAIDGYMLETRFDHFIYELAMIGRAHNWDYTREVVGTDGEMIREEYDNLQGDKPSCFSGVKRRLFQSVLGHPLLKILTIDDIKQMLRAHMREHFQNCITDITEENREEVALAWNKAVEEGIIDETSALKYLDVSEKKQAAILDFFNNHPYYGAQFREEPSFGHYIIKRFESTPHAAYFGGETYLSSLLAYQAEAESKEDTLSEIDKVSVSKEDLLSIEIKLNRWGQIGELLLSEVECLTKGLNSHWNNIWQKAPEKLQAIVNAIQELESEEALNDALLDDTSRLRVALEIKVGSESRGLTDERCLRDILGMIDSLGAWPI